MGSHFIFNYTDFKSIFTSIIDYIPHIRFYLQQLTIQHVRQAFNIKKINIFVRSHNILHLYIFFPILVYKTVVNYTGFVFWAIALILTKSHSFDIFNSTFVTAKWLGQDPSSCVLGGLKNGDTRPCSLVFFLCFWHGDQIGGIFLFPCDQIILVFSTTLGQHLCIFRYLRIILKANLAHKTILPICTQK